jgi:hypothetical protein
MARANTVGSRLSVNLKTKAISQTVRMPSPKTAARRSKRFSNLTIGYRAAIRPRVENPPLLCPRRSCTRLSLQHAKNTPNKAVRQCPLCAKSGHLRRDPFTAT